MELISGSEFDPSRLMNFVDLDVLQRIQDTFARAMGVAAVTVDRAGKPITRTSNFSNLCLMVRSTPEGMARCFKCDAVGGLKAYQVGGPFPYICGGGLLDAAAPIIIENVFVGSILCGQVIPTDAVEEFIEETIRRNTPLGLSAADVEKAARQIVPLPRDRFKAAIEMLAISANYIIEKSIVNLAQAKLLREEHERAALQVALKEAQLRAYKAQINPHFLFNSLTLLSYTALEENAPRTEEIAYSLSDLLRYSLRNISTSVELGEEIEMIEQYLAIQKIGFGSRLQGHVELEPALKDFAIPCMVLQPLVENAVIHGAEPLSRTVTITVRAYRERDQVILEVGDDGLGMPPSIAEKINRGNFSGDGESLGLQNVLQRLAGEYGERFYARVLTAPNEGTLIRIYIPIEMPIQPPDFSKDFSTLSSKPMAWEEVGSSVSLDSPAFMSPGNIEDDFHLVPDPYLPLQEIDLESGL